MLKQKPVRSIQKSNVIKQSQLIPKFRHSTTKAALSKRFISVSILFTITVWIIWLVLAGPSHALSNLIANWEAAVTMIFGSMVAGGTSMGGGSVAFPVFTKVLHVPPNEAKVFSLAIQSIGMSAASLTIVAMGTKVEWPFIRWASLGGLPGIIIGSGFLAPLLPANLLKLSFTMMVSSFAVFLLVMNQRSQSRRSSIPCWHNWERLFSIGVGLWGGIVSGLVGSGMDIFCFSVMILFFGLSEKVATPTSVILMAINAIVGFLTHLYILEDFGAPIVEYWLAAVPVVVVGAPAGAFLSSLMTHKTIAKVLLGLILVELISSILIVPMNNVLVGCSMFVLIVFTSLYYWMYKSKRYAQTY